jgi:hypothetical protein
MVNPTEYVTFRRGREVFVVGGALMSAVALDLFHRGDWQALMFAMSALLFIPPIRERPNSVRPAFTALFAVMGVALWFAIRYGIPAILRGLA